MKPFETDICFVSALYLFILFVCVLLLLTVISGFFDCLSQNKQGVNVVNCTILDSEYTEWKDLSELILVWLGHEHHAKPNYQTGLA